MYNFCVLSPYDVVYMYKISDLTTWFWLTILKVRNDTLLSYHQNWGNRIQPYLR